MVAGRLQEKNGFYYIVLSYTDSAGKRRQPWIGTGLPVKGNKKRAEKMLADTRKDFTIPKGQVSELSPDMAFSDYMRYWLKMMRTAVTETTYSSYCFNVEKHIIQEWLGHSDISTTANIYAHLDSQSKNLSARTMANTLTLPEAQPIKKW